MEHNNSLDQIYGKLCLRDTKFTSEGRSQKKKNS